MADQKIAGAKHAGCGVLAGSDPDTEVREAAAKLIAVREALEGLR